MTSAGSSTPVPVVVSAVGMCSSLGPDVVSSCAAARAGITRAREQVHFEVLDEEAGDTVPLAAHSAVGTEGFVGLGRLIRLGVAGLRDLLTRAALGPELLHESAFVVNLPTGFYEEMAEGAQQREDGSTAYPPRVVTLDGPELTERRSYYLDRLIPRLLTQAGLGALRPHAQVVVGDQAGWATALAWAMHLLSSGAAKRCIAGGIDSLLDSEILAALLQANLLKTPENPVGLMPGESAAFLLVERMDAAAARGAKPLAVLGPPVLLQGEPHELSGEPVTGERLAGTISAAVAADTPRSPDLVLCDCSGTHRTAMEWGSALVRLPREVGEAPQWFPAAMFGATGAATGPVSACVAVRAFERGYAPGSEVLTWLASARGDRAAIRLSRP
jgi:hypothetical protein